MWDTWTPLCGLITLGLHAQALHMPQGAHECRPRTYTYLKEAPNTCTGCRLQWDHLVIMFGLYLSTLGHAKGLGGIYTRQGVPMQPCTKCKSLEPLYKIPPT